jgi:hypothetical protein
VPVLEEIMSDTQGSGIGNERWNIDSGDGTDTGAEVEKASLPARPVSQENRAPLEVRIEALETRLDTYTKELREALKVLLHKERSRNDKLLIAYPQLKTKYEALKEVLPHPDRLPADVHATDSIAEPPQNEKTFKLVTNSEKQDRQR